MEHDPKAYLFDIKQACDEIKNFTQGTNPNFCNLYLSLNFELIFPNFIDT